MYTCIHVYMYTCIHTYTYAFVCRPSFVPPRQVRIVQAENLRECLLPNKDDTKLY